MNINGNSSRLKVQKHSLYICVIFSTDSRLLSRPNLNEKQTLYNVLAK